MTTDLPELPEPRYGVWRIRADAEQYGIACWNAAIEAAAREYERLSRVPVGAGDGDTCALSYVNPAAIRALTKGTT